MLEAVRRRDKGAPGRRWLGCLGLASLLATASAHAQSSGSETTMSAPQVVRAQFVPREYTTLASEIAARIDRIGRRPVFLWGALGFCRACRPRLVGCSCIKLA